MQGIEMMQLIGNAMWKVCKKHDYQSESSNGSQRANGKEEEEVGMAKSHT